LGLGCNVPIAIFRDYDLRCVLRWKVFGSPGVADVVGGVLHEVFLKIPKSNDKARH
jgi:hypothetical protein